MVDVVEIKPGISDVLRQGEGVPPADVLANAADLRLTHVVVVGYDLAGKLHVAGSHATDQTLALLARAVAWMAERRDIDHEGAS